MDKLPTADVRPQRQYVRSRRPLPPFVVRNTLSDVRVLNKMSDDVLAILNEKKENSVIKIQARTRGNQARGMMVSTTIRFRFVYTHTQTHTHTAEMIRTSIIPKGIATIHKTGPQSSTCSPSRHLNKTPPACIFTTFSLASTVYVGALKAGVQWVAGI